MGLLLPLLRRQGRSHCQFLLSCWHWFHPLCQHLGQNNRNRVTASQQYDAHLHHQRDKPSHLPVLVPYHRVCGPLPLSEMSRKLHWLKLWHTLPRLSSTQDPSPTLHPLLQLSLPSLPTQHRPTAMIRMFANGTALSSSVFG
ncbi:hypothetical protein ANANG_G00283100 [Anguilla anguilla]|uniref:Uncharacterized protein n=1 Tax=Anguilla anguilla TaxID=7936 RepID=A0A9D3LKJ4_ANGAN|nr:hypothetical protein ANANG_G00283100 [Anguilla anguilla]